MEQIKWRQELEQEIRQQQEVVRRAADDLSEAWRRLASLTAELEALPPPRRAWAVHMQFGEVPAV